MGACGSSQVQPGDIETDPIGKGPQQVPRRPPTTKLHLVATTLASARPRPQLSCTRRR